ncbi:MAG: hypothetical protein KDC95_15385 [Planctomycetes bacterium]|nr:hypothetical protein [Planctomycetota bacterium]
MQYSDTRILSLRSPSRISGITAVLLLLGPAWARTSPPQADRGTRHRTGIRVVDLDNRPWAEARVVLAGRALFGEPESELDVVELVTGEDGRVSAMLLDGRFYDAWAYAPLTNEAARITSLRRRVVAGSTILLEETHHAKRREIRLSGRDAWSGSSLALKVEIDGDAAHTLDVHVDGDAQYSLPFVPGDVCHLFVENERDSVLHYQPIPRDGEGSAIEVRLPDAFGVPLRCLDRRSEGARGVDVYKRVGRHKERYLWYRVGATTDGGWLDGTIPVGAKRGRETVHWMAAGPKFVLEMRDHAVDTREERDFEVARRENDAVVLLKATYAASPVRGRVLVEPGKPLAAQRILAYTSYGSVSGSSFALREEPIVLVTGDDGTFELEGASSRFALRLVVDAPFAILTTRIIDEDRDLGDFVLSKLHDVVVEVRREDGFPAANAEIAIVEHGALFDLAEVFAHPLTDSQPSRIDSAPAVRRATERRGTARVLLPESAHYLAIAIADAGVCKPIRLELRSDAPSSTPVRVEFAATSKVRGSIVTRDGTLVPGVGVHCVPTAIPPDMPRAIWTLMQQRVFRSDSAGAFEIAVPARNTSYNIRADRQGSKQPLTTQPVVVPIQRGSGDFDPVRVILPPPTGASRKAPRDE